MRFPFSIRQARLTKAPRRNHLNRHIGHGFERLEDRRLLATIPVTLSSDAVSPVDDGEITLREAIQYVNGVNVPDTDKTAFDFANLGTNDTIHFALPAGENTITLAHGELSITESVKIDAEGQGITIDASGNDPTPNVNNGDGSRVFSISLGISQEPRDVTLAGLTITGGDSSLNGGGLYFDSSAFPSGDVTLTPY